MSVQLSTVFWYLSSICRYLSGLSHPLMGPFLACGLVSSHMEIWDASKTTALLCRLRSASGMWKACAAGLCCCRRVRFVLYRGEKIAGTWWTGYWVCICLVHLRVTSEWMVSGCLTDRSRVGLRHREEIWRQLLISNRVICSHSMKGRNVCLYQVGEDSPSLLHSK